MEMKMRSEDLLAGPWGVLGLWGSLPFSGACGQLASSVLFLNQIVRAYLHPLLSSHTPP